MTITAEVTGAEELAGQLKILSKISDREMVTSLFEGAKVLETEVKRNIRTQKLIDTGNYRTSVKAEKKRDEADVHTDVIYARIHEYGGTITAKRAPYLVFFWKGRWFRVKSVTIPARPHWRPAIDNEQKKILDAIEKSLLIFLQRVSRSGR